jgi:hypothetical protein
VGGQGADRMTEREEGHMQQHLCECMVDLLGEKLTVIWKCAPNDLVPWPEIAVLMHIHGEQSVYDIKPVAVGPRETLLKEKERLVLKYGREAVEGVYAGRAFNMEFFVPGWPVDPTKQTRAKSKAQDHRPPRKHIQEPDADAEATDARI